MKRGRGDKKACAYFFEKSIVMQAFKYLNEAKTKDLDNLLKVIWRSGFS